MGLAQWCRRCRWQRTQQKTYRNSTPIQHGTTVSQRFNYPGGCQTGTRRIIAMSPFCTRHVLFLLPRCTRFCTRRVHQMQSSCNRLFTWPVARYRSQGVSTRAAKVGKPAFAGCQRKVSRQTCLRLLSGHSGSTVLCSTKAVDGISIDGGSYPVRLFAR